MISLLIILFIILLIFYGFFLIPILRGLKKLIYINEKKPLAEYISIIIPFRNEEENIINNLKSIEAQDYPAEKYEVIYVNDSSTDNTLKILRGAIKQENIKLITVENTFNQTAHKKRAVKFGIENSSGEIIVTTDADCTHERNWLKTLLSTFEKDTAFVSGPVEFVSGKSFFSKLQEIEFAGLILVGAGLIGNNKPVTCNAANIAYRKNVYQDLNGFEDQLHLSSGDDELLMQKIHKSKKYEVRFCLNRNAVVKTKPLNSFIQFYHQRKRWASKSIFYSDKKLILKLIVIFLFYSGLLFELAFTFFISKIFLVLFAAGLFIKFLLEYLIIKKGKEILFPNLKTKYFLAAELFQVPYIIISSISGLFGNFEWKERKVKR
jgi:cellulose synthase/poly-beta-1,6-N-acetylglucosamine synthase-like glycosyltransferase